MQSAKLVSVILPTYQREKLLAEAIQSVLSQSYKDWELWVIDDGSTDQTAELVRCFREKDGRIRYFHQSNSGPASARNKGMELSQGEFIAFLDSDDLWLPVKLQKQMEIFHGKPEIGFVYCGGHFLNENGSIDEKTTKRLRPKRLYDAESILFDHVNFVTPGVMLRRNCLEKSGGFDESLQFFEDVDMWFRILLFHRAEFLDEDLVIIRKHASNLARMRSSYPALDLWRNSCRMRRKIIALYEQNVRPLRFEEKEKALYSYQLDLIKECLATGFRAEGRREMVSYFETHPWFLQGVFYYLLSWIPGRLVPFFIAARRKRKAKREDAGR